MKSPSSKSSSGSGSAANAGRAASASNAGMSPLFGPQQSTMECPGSPSQSPHWSSFLYPVDPVDQSIGPVAVKPTIPCDVSTLKLNIANAEKSHTLSLASQRRQEAVAASVPGDYRYKLQHKDLIVEIIAPVEETTKTYARNKPSVTKASKDHEPVKVTATATPASSCGQTHPGLSASGGDVNETSEKKPVKFDVFSPAPSGFESSSWGRLWPFGDSRSKEIVIKAESCGFNPGKAVTKDLSILVVAIPDESWKITLGLGTYSSGSISKKKKHSTGPDKKDTGTVISRKRKIGHERVERSEIQIADTQFSESFSYSQTSGVLLQKTESLVEKDSTWSAPSFEQEKESKLRKIKIERTVGGQTTEADVSKVANGILDTIDAIKKLESIFDGIPKIGWSISASFSFLTGKAVLEWGYRWPRNFSESQRVYYAERFITLGGEVELAAGSVEAMFGIEIDPWWAPFYFVAKFYLEISASVSILPSGSISFTNWSDYNLDLNPMDLDAKAEIKAKLGGKAGGRIIGYELRAEIRLESSLTFDIDGKISRKGPEAKCSLISDGAKIVGEIIEIGDIEESHRFKPIEVMKSKDIFKDKVIF